MGHSKPSRPQSKIRKQRAERKRVLLLLLVARVEPMAASADRHAIEVLMEQEDGKMEFRAGAYVVCMGAVTGTSTASYEAALQSWLRIATRKLEKMS